MCGFTPNASWITTTPPRGGPCDSARSKPSRWSTDMASPEFDAVVAFLGENLSLSDPNATAQELRAGMESGSGAMPLPEGITFEATSAAGVPALWVRPDGARD